MEGQTNGRSNDWKVMSPTFEMSIILDTVSSRLLIKCSGMYVCPYVCLSPCLPFCLPVSLINLNNSLSIPYGFLSSLWTTQEREYMYVPIPDYNLREDSEEDADVNDGDYGSGSDNYDQDSDVQSETEEVIVEEDEDEDEDDGLHPIAWDKKTSWMTVPKEAEIQNQTIQLKPEFSNLTSKYSEPYVIVKNKLDTDDIWNYIQHQTHL